MSQHREYLRQAESKASLKGLGASPMALTLCFREPVGASPGPEFAGEFA